MVSPFLVISLTSCSSTTNNIPDHSCFTTLSTNSLHNKTIIISFWYHAPQQLPVPLLPLSPFTTALAYNIIILLVRLPFLDCLKMDAPSSSKMLPIYVSICIISHKTWIFTKSITCRLAGLGVQGLILWCNITKVALLHYRSTRRGKFSIQMNFVGIKGHDVGGVWRRGRDLSTVEGGEVEVVWSLQGSVAL
jgi:hypothetical protein